MLIIPKHVSGNSANKYLWCAEIILLCYLLLLPVCLPKNMISAIAETFTLRK